VSRLAVISQHHSADIRPTIFGALVAIQHREKGFTLPGCTQKFLHRPERFAALSVAVRKKHLLSFKSEMADSTSISENYWH
jgi:hypothetical protein